MDANYDQDALAPVNGESCVEYKVFLIDKQLEARAALSALESVRKAATQLADSLTRDYIWQKEAFRLSLRVDEGLTYLHGSTQFGDSIEDEWLIVYILRELSKSFPNIWIRVFDGDGEFLLIEAAKVLPRWLDPEHDSNRTWIQNGQLLIIHRESEKNGAAAKAMTLPEALASINSDSPPLLHSPLIESEAFYRLEKYPDQIASSNHHAVVIIPRKLAYILHARPKAIAPATESLYLRDPQSLKVLLKPPQSLVFQPADLVTLSIRFTKVLYSQLQSQRFQPPPAWKTLIAEAELKVATQDSEVAQKQLNRLLLGMKVTSGFEMLVAKRNTNDSRVAQEVAILLDDLDEDGVAVLPTDEDIKGWPNSDREDDDSWMNIDFEDLDRELKGEKGGAGGFGDPKAHADLQKLVSRFEAFLNEDEADSSGENDDEGDEDDEYTDEDSEDEDKDVSFDEEQFATMMREMMGLPPETPSSHEKDADHSGRREPAVAPPRKESDEDEQIRGLMEQMESELNEHGALALDPTPSKLAALKGKSNAARGEQRDRLAMASHEDEEDDTEGVFQDVDIDYNLARNLLESFKAQAGLAGPAGNMLGMLGLKLPRDEGEEDENDTEARKE